MNVASTYSRRHIEGFVTRCLELGLDANTTEMVFHKAANNQFLSTPKIYEGFRQRLNDGTNPLSKAAMAKYLTPDVLSVLVDCRIKFAHDPLSTQMRAMLEMPEPGWDLVPEEITKVASCFYPEAMEKSAVEFNPVMGGLSKETIIPQLSKLKALFGGGGLGAAGGAAVGGALGAPAGAFLRMNQPDPSDRWQRHGNISRGIRGALRGGLSGAGIGAIPGAAAGVGAGMLGHSVLSDLAKVMAQMPKSANAHNAENIRRLIALTLAGAAGGSIYGAAAGGGIGANYGSHSRMYDPTDVDKENDRKFLHRGARGFLRGGLTGAGIGLGTGALLGGGLGAAAGIFGKQSNSLPGLMHQYQSMPLHQQVLIASLLGSGLGAAKRGLMPNAEDQIEDRGALNRMGRGALTGGAVGAGAGLGIAGLQQLQHKYATLTA